MRKPHIIVGQADQERRLQEIVWWLMCLIIGHGCTKFQRQVLRSSTIGDLFNSGGTIHSSVESSLLLPKMGYE